MKAAMHLAVFSTFLILGLTPAASHAVCGDVSGDDDIEASDALRVLRAAVGQDVDLTCTARHGQARIYNAFECSSGSDKLVLETDHGQEFSVDDVDDYSDYQVMEMGEVEGFNYKQCGQNIRFDGPFTIAAERKTVIFMIAGDPDFYGNDRFIITFRDEGPRAGAPEEQSLAAAGQTMAVIGQRQPAAD